MAARMRKIVINKCFGGVGLSQEALIELRKRDDEFVAAKNKAFVSQSDYDSGIFEKGSLFLNEEVERDNLKLVEVVEQLGSQANSSHAELKVIEIPYDVEYIIEEYDGAEWVAEVHRTWS